MPKAILAMRTYPATLLLALLIFLATLLITTGSLGKVLSGGDGDGGDGGSGMGGTGKSGEFGGSGFGGTGGPSPFFTSTDSEEQQKTPQFSIPSREQSAPVIIAQDPLVEESPSIESPSVLSERIIEAIDSNPLLEATRKEIAQSSEQTEDTLETASQSRPALQLVELNNTPEQPVLDSLQRPQTPFQDSESIQESQQALRQVVAENENAELSKPQRQNDQQFAENIAVKLDTEQQASEQTRDRDGLPERIQRPDLPPFQRIRPIERPALMPPRVQPMRI